MSESLTLFEYNVKRAQRTYDFSCIMRDCVYGENTKTIYKEFCKTLKWDESKITEFGMFTPLYAENADTDRKFDVWFIYIANKKVDDVHLGNYLYNNGDIIIEKISTGPSNPAGRIVFLKTNKGYAFLGVYDLVKNGNERRYERISDTYPIIKRKSSI